MECRFCTHKFEDHLSGRELVLPILSHVGREHPVELMNMCVKLPMFQGTGLTKITRRSEELEGAPDIQSFTDYEENIGGH